jgi:hypothetical protein
MFHSIELVKAIHDDRVREIERTVRDRRAVLPSMDGWTTPEIRPVAQPSAIRPATLRRGGSACEPA